MSKDNTAETRVERLLSASYRVLVWAALLLILYILRSFFLLIFLTFVFAYLQENAVRRLEPLMPGRTKRVIAVALSLLAIILLIGAFLLPRFREQAANFTQRLPSYLATLDQGIVDMRARYPGLQDLLPDPSQEPEVHGRHRSTSAAILRQLYEGPHGPSEEDDLRGAVKAVREVGAVVLGIISAFLLSLLFSFLIVLDFPNLAASTRELRNTKIGFIYEEVAQSIRDCSVVVGRALEAQMFIAMLNTVLTAIGISLMGLGDQVAFLSVIVFFCSFIPVAGVFISSVPICLLALQEGGVNLTLIAVALITGIHMVEAYILNPRIYGAHLRMNPVIVLAILTVMGKIFGVWGLVLGVPVSNYIFGHAIRHRRVSEETAHK